MSEKIRKIYDSFNDSEKHGLNFGLFPGDKCEGLTKEELVMLMELNGQ